MYNRRNYRLVAGYCKGNKFLFERMTSEQIEFLIRLTEAEMPNPLHAFWDKAKLAKAHIDKYNDELAMYGTATLLPHPDPVVQKMIEVSDEEYDAMYEEAKRQGAYWLDMPRDSILTLFLRTVCDMRKNTGTELPVMKTEKSFSTIDEMVDQVLSGKPSEPSVTYEKPELDHRFKADERRKTLLPELVRSAVEMRNTLAEKVIGQDHAVQAFAEGYFNASVLFASETDRKRPMAVYTFAGPPGVGKTYLAESAAEHLGLPFRRFDMTEYSHHEASKGLLGFEYTWRDSAPGILTTYVMENPKCVLLFDEIEKAHRDVLQIFYQILDAGVVSDLYYKTGRSAAESGAVHDVNEKKMLLDCEPDVSFKDTIIIFTSNVGRSLYEGDKPKNAAGVTRKMLLNAFETETDPLKKDKYFPSALVSRIATGYPILFNHLEPHQLVKLIENEYERAAVLFGKNYNIKLKADPLVFLSLLFAESGRSDARTLKAQTERFFKNEIFKLFSLAEEDLTKYKTISFEAETENLPETVDRLFFGNDLPEILVYSNAHFATRSRNNLPEYKFHTAQSVDEAVKYISENDIRMAIIDIAHINTETDYYDAEEPDDGKTVMASMVADMWKDGKKIFAQIREKFPELPVYILETMYELSDELVASFVRAGARGKLKEPESYEDYRQFGEKLSEISRELYMQNMAETVSREHKVLYFETAPKLMEDKIVIKLRNFELKQSPDADDADELLSNIERPDVRFSDVIGAEAAKNELSFFTDYLKNPKKYAALGFRLPKGILLYGKPGTGKTMLAKALAGESDVSFLSAKASAFVNTYAGSGPKAVRELFAKARRYAPAIIFIDEADTIGRKRTGSESSRAEEDTLNALLAEMDGFSVDPRRPVFVLAATNYDTEEGKGGIGVLDEAFMRRFDRKILIELPNKDERRQFIKLMLSKIKKHDVTEEQINSIAERSIGMSPAILDNVIEAAKRKAFDTETVLNDKILDEAFETVQFGEKKDWGKERLERTARHESGHAVINYLCGNTPSYLTIEARSDFGGYMRFSDEQINNPTMTKKQLLDKVRAALGGRAAEIVYYGDEEGLDTGATGDLKSATELVRSMIVSYGMDDGFGIAAVDYKGAEAEKLNAHINEILSEEMKNAMEIIRNNRDKVDILTEALLERNRLTGSEIAELI